MALPVFGFVSVHQRPLARGIDAEAEWAAQAAAHGRPLAHLWEGEPGWVVPRSYTRAPGWAALADQMQVRASGGGLVPQGPGLLNLSLVWPAGSAQPTETGSIYRELCDGLARALARLGIAASAQAVDGSFCDGRFNLAIDGRKVAGTAQAWRRVAGQPVVLAHAVILVEADVGRLTGAANAIEAALGQPRRYRADAVTTLAAALAQATGGVVPPDFGTQVRRVVAEQFARVVPPRVATG